MEKSTSRVVRECQVCNYASLEPILFLGYLPQVNDFRSTNERLCEKPSYPADIFYCNKCNLVQAGFIVNPKIIFPPSYAYMSSITRVLRKNFIELYRECATMFPLKKNDFVVDIGSNDGTLLDNFKEHTRILGVTPENIGKIAIERGIPTILDYFTKNVAEKIVREYGRAKVVTAANVFAHMDNINEVVESILEILEDNGVFVIEVHYLPSFIELNQFDFICHEHLRHYSLHSLRYLLEIHGLEIIHAKRIPSHAGSVRVYAARKDKYGVRSTVRPLLDAEKNTVLKKDYLFDFKKRVVRVKLELMTLFLDIKRRGERIYGVGASSRGVTLIHYVGIEEGIVDYALEIKNSPKIGKNIPGTLIPILEESKLFEDQPEYAFLFSWNIADDLITKLKKKGYRGKFIIPLPTPKIVE